jgi:predicted Zn-dependent protease
MALVRISLVMLAVVVGAWFVLSARQAHEINRATSVIDQGSGAGRARLAGAGRELDAAAFLNPDRSVQILRGRLALSQGHPGKARRVLDGVVSAEPQNLEGWIWLVGAAVGDRRTGARALRHIGVLDPRDVSRYR